MRRVQRWTTRRLGLLIAMAMLVASGFGMLIPAPATANAKKQPIRVGILQPAQDPTGNAALLRDVVLMQIQEQNRKGGLLNRKLEPVVVSPGSDPHASSEVLLDLLNQDKVAVVFSAATDETGADLQQLVSGSNALLFDAAPSTGADSPKHVLRTGSAPNQIAIPAVDYLAREKGITRWVLAGTDAPWPRATNRIIESYLKARGVLPENILIIDTPQDLSDWNGVASDIRSFAGGAGNTAVISTILGDAANNGFYRALAAQGLSGQKAPELAAPAQPTPANTADKTATPAQNTSTANALPVLSLSLGEEDLQRLDRAAMAGTLITSNYLMSAPTPDNKAFLDRWRTFSNTPDRAASDRVEAHVLGFNMWAKAVAKAGTTDADPVGDAMTGIKQLSLTGGITQMLPNRHISRAVFMGEVSADGTLKSVWKSPGLIPGSGWAEYLDGSSSMESDWQRYNCDATDQKSERCPAPSGEIAGNAQTPTAATQQDKDKARP